MLPALPALPVPLMRLPLLALPQGARVLPLVLSIALGLALCYLVPRPVGVSLQGWRLLSIFFSTIAGGAGGKEEGRKGRGTELVQAALFQTGCL